MKPQIPRAKSKEVKPRDSQAPFAAWPLNRIIWGGGWGRDALEGKGPQRRLQRRLDRRLEEVAKAVGGGYWRLRMPWKPALGVGGAVAGRRLGALEGGEGGTSPRSNASLGFFLWTRFFFP